MLEIHLSPHSPDEFGKKTSYHMGNPGLSELRTMDLRTGL
jgi:hypothetical protein